MIFLRVLPVTFLLGAASVYGNPLAFLIVLYSLLLLGIEVIARAAIWKQVIRAMNIGSAFLFVVVTNVFFVPFANSFVPRLSVPDVEIRSDTIGLDHKMKGLKLMRSEYSSKERMPGFWGGVVSFACMESREEDLINYVKLMEIEKISNPWLGRRKLCATLGSSSALLGNPPFLTLTSNGAILDSVSISDKEYILMRIKGDSAHMYTYE